MRRVPVRKIIVLLCWLAFCGAAHAKADESEYNLGVEAYRVKDYAAARQHWAKAIEETDVTVAKNNLGYLLYYGLGGATDKARAVSLWTQAAHGGDRESQWHLGQAFEDGKAVEQNVVKAYAWYRCAAEGAPSASGGGDLEARIVEDTSKSLARLSARLSPAEREAGEKLAKRYIASYPKVTLH